jgi:hypothetical protein
VNVQLLSCDSSAPQLLQQHDARLVVQRLLGEPQEVPHLLPQPALVLLFIFPHPPSLALLLLLPLLFLLAPLHLHLLGLLLLQTRYLLLLVFLLTSRHVLARSLDGRIISSRALLLLAPALSSAGACTSSEPREIARVFDDRADPEDCCVEEDEDDEDDGDSDSDLGLRAERTRTKTTTAR